MVDSPSEALERVRRYLDARPSTPPDDSAYLASITTADGVFELRFIDLRALVDALSEPAGLVVTDQAVEALAKGWTGAPPPTKVERSAPRRRQPTATN